MNTVIRIRCSRGVTVRDRGFSGARHSEPRLWRIGDGRGGVDLTPPHLLSLNFNLINYVVKQSKNRRKEKIKERNSYIV